MAVCKHKCKKTPIFPGAIFNRPALDNISYRVGTYSSMRDHMLDLLNASEVLSAWTHRHSDDPGIALLEGNAMVGDILTFYQSLYANEAFLRSADWRESVADLVQLLGYRLAPGVGGEATFTLKVKGNVSVTVPKGFGFKAQMENRDKADEFESTAEITAHPHLSKFHLYQVPLNMQAIAANGTNNQLELHAVGESDKQDYSSFTSVDIRAGDRIMLVPESAMFDTPGTPYTEQAKPEILIVSAVQTVLNRVIITFEGALTENRGNIVDAYVVGRTFRHFGFNASRKLTKYDATAATPVTSENTNFERTIASTQNSSTYYSSLTDLQMPLDQEVDDLASGAKLICQGIADFEDHTIPSKPVRTNHSFVVVKTIKSVEVNTLQWAHVEGAITVVNVDSKLMSNDDIWYETTDIRRAQFHEVLSPKLSLRAPCAFANGPFSQGKLEFYGTYAQARALAKRDLLLVNNNSSRVQAVATTSTLADFEGQLNGSSPKDKVNPWLWTVTLGQVPVFNRESFDQAKPEVTVYGNLVQADQGKTEQQVVLGSGDNRQTFQTFALPKAPLAYLLNESQTPAQVPELAVYVEDILWSRVDTFFNCGPKDEVYVVREDHDDNSYVQFGNGKTGMRLPSGHNNVTGIYRTGTGATGVLPQDAKAQATGRLKDLDSVFLPGEVVGGDEPEDLKNAREAAPGKMQSLGRLVGLADFEAETLSLPGVLRVRADWAAPSGSPLVRIVVLTKAGTGASLQKVQDSLRTYTRCRGPARFPISVAQGNLQYVYLAIRVCYAANHLCATVKAAIQKALGLTGQEGTGIDSSDGLFSLNTRRFGQTVHLSQIQAAVQQVKGVTWLEIDDAQALDLGTPPETDPKELPKPSIAATDKIIACAPNRILALHSLHLDLSLAIDDTKKECE